MVRTSGEVGPAALEEQAHPERLAEARRAIARDMFHEPGTATERALAMVYQLLELPAPEYRALRSRQPSLRSSARPSFG